MTRAEESFRAEVARALAQARAGWLAELRRSAGERFEMLGLPTTRHEDWRFTSLAALGQHAFGRSQGRANGVAELEARLAIRPDRIRLVFVDGRYRAELSAVDGLPAGAHAGSLAEALLERPESVEPHLARHAAFQENAFAALNTALVEDGALIEIPAGVRVEAPIHLVFVSFAPVSPTATHPRTLVLAGDRSETTVIETYLGSGERPYLTNAVSELVLGDEASLDHYKVQEEGPAAFHVGIVESVQGRGTHLATHSIALGAALARNEVRAVLAGEGGEASLNGLYMVGGRQHVDNLSLIEHAVPRCSSRESYKGILDGESRAVFSGRIRVRPGAQKTDAYQSNSNLLLSDDAVVDTKPQLEIFADDVKCGHGGTVGQLDDAALFYLRSRGIDSDLARSLLTYAFASEMVGRVRPTALRDRVRALVTARLPGGDRLSEAA